MRTRPSTTPLPRRPPAGASKEAWRWWARSSRRLLVTAERSRRVAEGLADWAPYRHATTVLLYLAFASEIDLAPLLDEPGKRVLIPRSEDVPEPELSLHQLRGAVLERHPFGPQQPRSGTPAVDPSEVEVVVLPGLCFDGQGTRLGYGRGYFDRFLPRLRPDVPRVGVTLDALIVERLPREPHDAGVTHLATESGVRVTTPPRPPRAPPSS